MNYLTAKPIIGYYNTENEGRKWLVVAITVTDDNRYRWYQIDARDGKIVSSDVFPGESAPSLTNRPLTGISGNVETIFPSRILYAYPRYPSNYNNEPVLSDVYVYLSNGSIYDWNIQDQQAPRKIARIFTNTDNFVPPAADFDITYMDGRRFISALVYFNHNNLAQSVYGLILGDLDQILEREDRLNINLTSFGWSGNVFATGGSGLAGIQLEYFKQSTPGGGAVTPNFTAVSSPVFVEGKLYLPVFVSVTQQQGGLGTVRLTRLYQIPDIAELISGKTLVAGEDYIDIPAEVDGELVANMILDPEGRLLLLDSEGNVIKTIDTNLTFAGGNVGGPGESIPGIKIKYWKIRS